MSCQDLKLALRQANRPEPHLNLVCPNGVPIDRKLCLLLLSHLQALSETLPPPYGRITMQVHPDHMIQLWGEGKKKKEPVSGKTGGEQKETGNMSWLRPHTQIKCHATSHTPHITQLRS